MMCQDGAALILLPGLNNTRAVFDAVVPALATSGVRGLALDNPALPSVEAIAEALLPSLPQRFWLAGFSFGGYVALAMLEAAPERIAGLALICTAPFADTPAQAERRQQALAQVAAGRYLDMVQAQSAQAFHPDSLKNEALLAARARMVRDYGAESYAAHVRATIARPDRRHLLDGRRPLLVVAGAQDAMFAPAQLKDYASQVPGSHFEVIDGAAHLVPMEQPAALAEVLSRWVLRQPEHTAMR